MNKYSLKTPEVSVTMPVYNTEKFISESIESILNQTFEDFELILVNDFSSDNSLKILNNYKKKDKRIRVINNKKNLGTVKSRNIALKAAKGKYIAVLDSDDISNKKRLNIQKTFLDKNKHIYLVGSSAIFIDKDGKEIRRFRKLNNFKILRWRLPKSCGIIHSSVMFRNDKSVKYNENYTSAHDYNLYLDILSQGKNLTNLSDFLIKHRVHQTSFHTSNKKKQEYFRNKTILEHKDLKSNLNIFEKIYYSIKLAIFYLKTRKEKKLVI